ALGLSQVIGDALAAVGFYFAGRLIKRFGEFRLLIGGIGLNNGVTLLVTLLPGVLSPAVMSLPSFAYGIHTVATSGLMQREFTTDQRATMGSLTSFGGSLAFAVFSLALGALGDRIGPAGAFAVATALGFLPAYFYWRAFRHESRKAFVLSGD